MSLIFAASLVLATMSDGVTIALIVGATTFAATTAPLFLAHMTNRANMRNKQLDWERQDEVAARAEAAAAAQLKAQHQMVDGVNTVQSAVDGMKIKLSDVEGTTKVILSLANSDKTAQLRNQRDSLAMTLALMREVVSLKQAAGQEPAAETVAALDSMEQAIHTLDQTILDRLAQQHAVEEFVAREKAKDEKAKDEDEDS